MYLTGFGLDDDKRFMLARIGGAGNLLKPARLETGPSLNFHRRFIESDDEAGERSEHDRRRVHGIVRRNARRLLNHGGVQSTALQ